MDLKGGGDIYEEDVTITLAVVGLLIMRSSNKDVAYTHQQVFDIKDVRSAKLSVLQK